MDAEQREKIARDVDLGMWPEQTTGMRVGMPKGVKATHKPTGIVVICDTERSQHKNREKALDFIARALQAQPGWRVDGATNAAQAAQLALCDAGDSVRFFMYPDPNDADCEQVELCFGAGFSDAAKTDLYFHPKDKCSCAAAPEPEGK